MKYQTQPVRVYMLLVTLAQPRLELELENDFQTKQAWEAISSSYSPILLCG